MPETDISGYRYIHSHLNQSHNVLLPAVLRLLDELYLPPNEKRLFELGCGNGSVANELTRRGWELTGVNPSEEGIAQAHRSYHNLKVQRGSAYDDLAGQYGQFPVVLSLGMVEHVCAPRHYARTVFGLLAGGARRFSRPLINGYWKNLALALTGRMVNHFTALWYHEHIKFWSMDTLAELLRNAGFVDVRFERVGRIPSLTKSMAAIARKP